MLQSAQNIAQTLFWDLRMRIDSHTSGHNNLLQAEPNLANLDWHEKSLTWQKKVGYNNKRENNNVINGALQ